MQPEKHRPQRESSHDEARRGTQREKTSAAEGRQELIFEMCIRNLISNQRNSKNSETSWKTGRFGYRNSIKRVRRQITHERRVCQVLGFFWLHGTAGGIFTSLTRDRTWAFGNESADPNRWTTREFPNNAPGPCWLHSAWVTSSQPHSQQPREGSPLLQRAERQENGSSQHQWPARRDLPAGPVAKTPCRGGTEGPGGCLNTLGGGTSS